MTVKDEIPEDAFVLDEAEVDAVKYVDVATLEAMYRTGDKTLVPADLDGEVRTAHRILGCAHPSCSMPHLHNHVCGFGRVME